MAKLFVIAGPPASGKSTLIKLLKNPYPSWRFVVNDFFDFLPILKKKEELEKNFEQDLRLIVKIKVQKNTVIENGPLNAVYYHHFLGAKKAERYFLKSIKIYKKLNPLIFFIDTKPEISFRRQQESFLQILAENNIDKVETINRYLSLYQKALYDLYPLFEHYLKKLPFEVTGIKNSYIGQDEFVRESFLILQKVILYPS